MARVTSAEIYSKKFFDVIIEGIPTLSTGSVEGLGVSFEIGAHKDGTDKERTLKLGTSDPANVVINFAEATSPLTALFEWVNDLVRSEVNGGLVGEDLQKNATIIQKNEAGQTLMKVRCLGCLPVSFEPDTRDGTTADPAVAKLELMVTRKEYVMGDNLA